jgi:hypothetical protein
MFEVTGSSYGVSYADSLSLSPTGGEYEGDCKERSLLSVTVLAIIYHSDDEHGGGWRGVPS